MLAAIRFVWMKHEKYEIFAKFNQEKIDKLNKELNVIKERFNKQREKSIKEFPEIGQVEI